MNICEAVNVAVYHNNIEPEWKAEEVDYPLLGLLPYGFLPEDQRKPDVPKTLSLSESPLAIKFTAVIGRNKHERVTKLSLVEAESTAVKWSYPMCVSSSFTVSLTYILLCRSGHPVAVQRSDRVVVVASDSCEVYALDLECGLLVMPVLRVGRGIAALAVTANKTDTEGWSYAVLSRDARLWIPKVLVGVAVDPITSLFESGGMEPLDFEDKVGLEGWRADN